MCCTYLQVLFHVLQVLSVAITGSADLRIHMRIHRKHASARPVHVLIAAVIRSFMSSVFVGSGEV